MTKVTPEELVEPAVPTENTEAVGVVLFQIAELGPATVSVVLSCRNEVFPVVVVYTIQFDPDEPRRFTIINSGTTPKLWPTVLATPVPV